MLLSSAKSYLNHLYLSWERGTNRNITETHWGVSKNLAAGSENFEG